MALFARPAAGANAVRDVVAFSVKTRHQKANYRMAAFRLNSLPTCF